MPELQIANRTPVVPQAAQGCDRPGSRLGQQCRGVANSLDARSLVAELAAADRPGPSSGLGRGQFRDEFAGISNMADQAAAPADAADAGRTAEVERFNTSFLKSAHDDVESLLHEVAGGQAAGNYRQLQDKPGTYGRNALDSLALALSVAKRNVDSEAGQVKRKDCEETAQLLAKLLDKACKAEQKGKGGAELYFGAYDARANNTKQLDQFRAVCAKVNQLVKQQGGHEHVVRQHYDRHVTTHLQNLIACKTGGECCLPDGQATDLHNFLELKACEARDRMLDSIKDFTGTKRPEFAVTLLGNAFKTQGQSERFLKDLLEAANKQDDSPAAPPDTAGLDTPDRVRTDDPTPRSPTSEAGDGRFVLADAFKNIGNSTQTNTQTVDLGGLTGLLTEMYQDGKAAQQAEKDRLQAKLDKQKAKLDAFRGESVEPSAPDTPGWVESASRLGKIKIPRAKLGESRTDGAPPIPAPDYSDERSSVRSSPSVITTQGGARANPAELRRASLLAEAERLVTPAPQPRAVSLGDLPRAVDFPLKKVQSWLQSMDAGQGAGFGTAGVGQPDVDEPVPQTVSSAQALRERAASQAVSLASSGTAEPAVPLGSGYQGKKWETVKPADRIITTELGPPSNRFSLIGS